MKIATYNVNGVNGRLPRLIEWLEETTPDIVCLQEIKTDDTKFPVAKINAAGYQAIWHGQRAHHGVAILVRGEAPIEIRRGLPGDASDLETRYLEAHVLGLTIASLYLPNGNPAPGPRFDYKLAWFERLIAHARGWLASGEPVVLAGDFNVVPTDADIYNAFLWRHDAVMQPETRALYERMLSEGWIDAHRHLHPRDRIYTFWVNAHAFSRNAGFRMDFLLLSPALAVRLQGAGVDAQYRGRDKPSDHAPTWITIEGGATRSDVPITPA
ncbi:MAG: exodeoxyribonuclease III [Pseudomonadota bacterium]|nr:exodeoxyribonuclease III [Pseudomonadota bacterium]